MSEEQVPKIGGDGLVPNLTVVTEKRLMEFPNAEVFSVQDGALYVYEEDEKLVSVFAHGHWHSVLDGRTHVRIK